MKITKLSLVAVMAISAAFAGGDIAPVEPTVVEAPASTPATTIAGKLQAYSYTWDASGDLDWYEGDSSALGTAVTIDVSHTFMEGVTANFSGVGFTNLTNNYMEGEETGAFLNVANITASFGSTTAVLGRQILDTPMVKSFDWLLAKEAYEAYTIVNTSVENLTLVASYLETYRPVDSGDTFLDLDGDNWIVGAAYSDGFDASLWYYNVDAADYTQVYADAGTSFSSIDVAAQFVSTDYGVGEDSTAFGIKAATSVSGFDLMAAYNDVSDATSIAIGTDGFYTSSWNHVVAGNVIGSAYKFEAATEFSGISATASYAYYENTEIDDEGSEIDVIVGYGVTDSISIDAIYTSTEYIYGPDDADNAMEIIVTYNF